MPGVWKLAGIPVEARTEARWPVWPPAIRHYPQRLSGALSKHENIIIWAECFGFLMYFGGGRADKTFQGLFGPYNWEEKQ